MRHPQARQHKQRDLLGCFFHQATKIHLGVAELAIDHTERMRDLAHTCELAYWILRIIRPIRLFLPCLLYELGRMEIDQIVLQPTCSGRL